jgi:hypothetical protein
MATVPAFRKIGDVSKLRGARVAIALASVLALAMATSAAAAVPSRSFDTNNDGKVDITIYDTDGDGYFEWPAGSRTLPGQLNFTETDRIAFSGTTTIQVTQGVFYAPGAQLVTRPGAPLQKLVILANGGDFGGYGLLDLTATGDVIITAKNELFLYGTTHVTTPGTIALTSKNNGVGVAQLTPDDYAPGAFALLAGKALNMLAKGNYSSVFGEFVRLGGRVINLTAQTSSTNSGSRYMLFRNDAVVTTDPARTGLSGTAGNITFNQSRAYIGVESGAVVDSAQNVVFKNTYGGSLFVCGATVEAASGNGVIDTRYVSGGVFRDPSSTISGTAVGEPFTQIPGC